MIMSLMFCVNICWYANFFIGYRLKFSFKNKGKNKGFLPGNLDIVLKIILMNGKLPYINMRMEIVPFSSRIEYSLSETHQQIIPPDFTRNLKSVDVLEGSPYALECHVMGIPSPTISWYKDEINIDNSPEYVITKINGTCCLKIKRVNNEHSARYTCRANNPGGEASSSARLTVFRKTPSCHVGMAF